MSTVIAGHCLEYQHYSTILLVGDLNQSCIFIDHRFLQYFINSLTIRTFMSSFYRFQAWFDYGVYLLRLQMIIPLLSIFIRFLNYLHDTFPTCVLAELEYFDLFLSLLNHLYRLFK